MVKYAAGHIVYRRLDDFEETARTLEPAAIDIKSATLDQTLPAALPAMIIFGADCTNIQDLTIRSAPMREMTEDHVRSACFDRLARLRIYYVLANGATASTFLLLAAMPNLKHLGINGLLSETLSEEVGFPDLPFALETFRYSGGISVAGAAHILSESWQHGTLRELGIHMLSTPSSLEIILSAAPRSLRKLDISMGRYDEEFERQPFVDITAAFLQQNTGIRHLELQLLPGIPLAGLIGDLRTDSRLVSLHLKDPRREDAAWLAEKIVSSRPLASLRALSTEYERDDEGVRIDFHVDTVKLLRSLCDQRRVRLCEVDGMMPV